MNHAWPPAAGLLPLSPGQAHDAPRRTRNCCGNSVVFLAFIYFAFIIEAFG